MKLFPKTISGLVATAACFLAVSASAFSATNKPVVVSARDFIGSFSTNRKTESVAANQQRSFIVSAAKAASVFNQASAVVLTDFPVTPYSDAVVELERSRPIIDGETVFKKNGKPMDESFTPPVVQTFRGKIRGEDHSKVLISMINGNITGSVEHENGERFVFSPLSTDKKDAREHMLFAEKGITISPEELGFTCMTPDDVDASSHSDSKHSSHDRALSTDLLEFQLAIDTDYKMFQRFGGDYEKMQEYVLSLIAMVSSIYEDEINVTFIVSEFNFWAETDPYQAGGDISVMLEKFSAYWRNNNSNIKRTIAHLITGPGSTNVGGIAYRDQLCNKYMGYSVSGIHASYKYPTTTYSWDVNVIAHEIGHNFRSHHTHACHVWGAQPLDTCVSTNGGAATADDACFSIPPVKAAGSIMSYCHLLNGKVDLTFTPPVAQVIRQGAEEANCMSAPATPKIFIQNPLGNQTYSAGMEVDIRWTSARVNMVGLEYSTNGGESWTNIVEAVAATTRKYMWKLPNIASSQMLVRVYDVSAASVNDQSTVTFIISAPTLSISYPLGEERFAQKSEVTVKWNKELIESVAVDFSANNGANWETQATGLTAKEYKWTVPTVTTSEGMIRVRDESNNEIISQSGAFTIGAPIILVTAPGSGTEWLVGSQHDIRWQSDFVDKVRIEYKTETKDWTRIGPFFVTATDGSYTWTIPNDLTQNALIRVRAAIGDENTADTSDTFIITNVVGVDEPAVASETFSIVPQPANDHVTINFSLLMPVNNVRIAVQDVTGRTVAEIFPEQHATGKYNVGLSTAPLAQGVYFVTIEAGGTTITRTLTVLH